MRGTLTNIFADAAKKQGAEYRYGYAPMSTRLWIRSLIQRADAQ